MNNPRIQSVINAARGSAAALLNELGLVLTIGAAIIHPAQRRLARPDVWGRGPVSAELMGDRPSNLQGAARGFLIQIKAGVPCPRIIHSNMLLSRRRPGST